MPETENREAALHNFRAEIKKIKEIYPSLFAVEDVDGLGQEEENAWEIYKSLFKKIHADLTSAKEVAPEQLAGWRAELDDLAKLIAGNFGGKIKDNNRLEFFAWMNNRLGVIVGNLYLLSRERMSKEEFMDWMTGEKGKLLFE